TICAPLLAKAAIYFGPAELFALFVLAVVSVGGVGSNNAAKTLLSGIIGLALSTVGLDPASGEPRFTFGSYELYDGIDFVVAAIGLFAISEFLFFIADRDDGAAKRIPIGHNRSPLRQLVFPAATLRASGLGFIIGVLPGAGATMASF